MSDALFDRAASCFSDLLYPGPVGVAVSGGGDSMALLALAHRAGLPVLAATVDHGLRSDAQQEAALVAEFCKACGIKHTILPIGSLPATGNLSANLRDARYQALTDWAAGHGIGQVMLGHTMDDQAETVLMRLGRGSGADGLAGMAARRVWSNIAWIRPLLDARRADLRAWLRQHAIKWADDPTNEDERFDRVKARSALAHLAPLGITVEGLADTARIVRAQAEVLQHVAQDLMQTAASEERCGLSLITETIASAPDDTALRVLAQVLCQVGGFPYRPRHRALHPLLKRIQAQEAFRTTLARCIIDTRLQPGLVLITPEPASP